MHSLRDIEEMTGQSRRTIQFWIEAGGLKPTEETNRAGRGVHREFVAAWCLVALILTAVSQNTWPIGRLIRVAERSAA